MRAGLSFPICEVDLVRREIPGGGLSGGPQVCRAFSFLWAGGLSL